MSLLTDIKNVSDTAIERLSARFGDLPRPLLAAIGAGDLAVERLATLREQIAERLGDARNPLGGGAPSGDDIKAFAADLPAKAQKAANDVAQHLEQFASTAPEKAQKIIGELPSKAQEFTNSLSPEKLRSTIDAYTQMVASVYDNLADRGGETVEKARAAGESGGATTAAASRASGGAKKASGRSPAASKPAAKKPAAKKRATSGSRSAGTKPAGTKSAAKKDGPSTPAGSSTGTDKPVGTSAS